MRRLNLVPAEILAARRRQALVRRSGAVLVAWGCALGLGFAVLGSWQRSAHHVSARLEEELQETRARGARVDSLLAARRVLLERVAMAQRLEGHRPVTGVVTLLAELLPAQLRLESLQIEPALRGQGITTPGSAAYFESGDTTLRLQLRGAARSPDEVAALLRSLQACERFRRVQLTRLDRPASSESGTMTFEMVCEL